MKLKNWTHFSVAQPAHKVGNKCGVSKQRAILPKKNGDMAVRNIQQSSRMNSRPSHAIEGLLQLLSFYRLEHWNNTESLQCFLVVS